MERIKGLDSLRFVMAFIVLLGHGTLPFINIPVIGSEYNELINGLLGNSTVGVAAVMAFFILSGFVIHYPYSEGKQISLPSFYTKRLLRISLPALLAFILYTYVFGFFMGVLWSLICEAIYYIIYPIILNYLKRLNWIIAISFLMSYALSVYTSYLWPEYNGDFHRNGYWLTWIIGLPVWLLGVHLAENYKSFKNKNSPTYKRLLFFRLLVFVFSIIASVLRFHFDISYVFSLPLFSILVYFWIQLEILYYKDKEENKLLVFGGLMSYSIYLVHALLIYIIEEYTGYSDLRTNVWYCILAILSSLIASYIFYILIEKPTHKLARNLGSKFK